MATGYLDNYYARLGVSINATAEEIRAAYHVAARKFHPDHNKEINSLEIFLQVQEAYETLSNPAKREEYDRQLPEDIKTPEEISINSVYSRQMLMLMNRPQLLYVLLNIAGLPNSPTRERKKQPLNIGLVLDTSTSMSGSRLNAVKETARKIIRSLNPEDVLSVTTFNDRAEVMIPAQRGQDLNLLESQISIITTGGGTEIGKGLQAGYQQMQAYLNSNFTHHLILITDGRTYGDEQVCLDIAASAAEKGISIHALGIGDKWNDEFLDHLASVTGGSCEFAQTTQAIDKFLTKKVRQIQDVFATNTTITYTLPDKVELRYAFRLNPATSSIPIDTSLVLGNIPKKQSLSVLLEFLIHDASDFREDVTLLDGTLSFSVPAAAIPTFTSRLTFTRPLSVESYPDPPPQVLVRAMSQLSLYRLQEMANQDLKVGNVERAGTRMRNLATQLLASGEDTLAKTVMLELDQMYATQEISEDAKKAIKYGTRALVLDPSERDA